MVNKLEKIIKYLLALFLFLLPWQTRWIYASGSLNGGFWEYGTLSLYGTEILLWLIVLLFLIERLSDKERRAVLFSKELFRVRRSRLFFVLMFLCFNVLIIFHSLSPQVSWQFMIRLLGAFCLGVIIVSHASRFMIHASCLWLGGVVQGLLALFQFFTQSVFGNKWLGMAYQSAKIPGTSVVEFGIERWLRAYGSFGSPNSLGVYLAVILVLGLILYMDNTPLVPLNRGESAFPPNKEGEGGVGHIYKLLITVGQLLVLSGLILSFSRASWLAAVAGVAVLIVIARVNSPLVVRDPEGSSDPRRGRGRGGLASPSFQEGVGGVADGMASAPQATANPFAFPLGKGDGTVLFKQLFYYLLVVILFFIVLRPLFLARFDSSNRLENMSLSERQTQLADFKKVFSTQPLLGVGPGAYTLALQKEYPKLSAWQYQPVHNIYLLALAEFGIIGFVLLAGLVVWVVKNIAKNNTRYLSLVVCLLIAGLFDHWLFSMWSGVALLGTVIGLSKISNIKNQK